MAPPAVDLIAVTHGPGLEPALWVGVNFARVLARLWDKAIMPVNHLEGHLIASAVTVAEPGPTSYHLSAINFPALGLIVSGGHTEFVYATDWGAYRKVGGTRDDSIGEAFDKVARMLGLPYPGGPEITRIAESGRRLLAQRDVTVIRGITQLPRPMIGSGDSDFSFSGLKTAVKYLVRDLGTINEQQQSCIAAEFQQAVTDVIRAKTTHVLEQMPVQTFLLGGGVSADSYIREQLVKLFNSRPEIAFRIPAKGLSTDNAIMIGMAGYLAHQRGVQTLSSEDDLRANGNLTW
jgi:N6-L-threonylcarbamoyladenine synthase